MSRKRKAPRPSVDLRTVERLADLSRLSVNRQEAQRLRGELSSILDYFATIDRVELTKSGPALEEGQEGPLREDVVRPSNPDEILSGVPRKKGRYVKAPRVF